MTPRLSVVIRSYNRAGMMFVIDWIWNDALRYQTALSRIGGSVLFVLTLPYHAIKMLGVSLGNPDGAAVPGAAVLTSDHSAPRTQLTP